jgi:hypothetical protein
VQSQDEVPSALARRSPALRRRAQSRSPAGWAETGEGEPAEGDPDTLAGGAGFRAPRLACFWIEAAERERFGRQRALQKGRELLERRGEVAMTEFAGRTRRRVAVLAGDPSFSGVLGGVFPGERGQAARISTSARFMSIAIATNCRWQRRALLVRCRRERKSELRQSRKIDC